LKAVFSRNGARGYAQIIFPSEPDWALERLR
jgi:hypothetical protein